MMYILSFFSLQNAVCFIILTYLVPILLTFYIHGVLKLKKKNNSATKGLKSHLVGSIGQQSEAPDVKFNLLSSTAVTKHCALTADT